MKPGFKLKSLRIPGCDQVGTAADVDFAIYFINYQENTHPEFHILVF
jgi:hypothetical protein